MPPPTPRTTLFGATARRNLVRILGQELVLHQPAPDFFHGDDGRLLRRRRQKRPGAVLQLTRPLGGDDDEAIDALFRIVRNGAMRIILWRFFRHRYKPLLYQTSPVWAGFAAPSEHDATARPAPPRSELRPTSANHYSQSRNR